MEPNSITLINSHDLALVAPAIVLGVSALIVLLVDLFSMKLGRSVLPLLTLGGLGLALIVHVTTGYRGAEFEIAFDGCLRFDRMTYIAQIVILSLTLFLTLVSPLYLIRRRIPRGEYYVLIMFAALAMMVLSASNELLTLFINLELLSFCLYILTGIEQGNLRSTEAAFKYFTIGSYAAAFLLFGMTMVYGATGATHFDEIRVILASGSLGGALGGNSLFLAGGFALMLVGFGFKLTLAPFHMYAPDVYAGAPTPVAGLIATGSKVAAVTAFFAIFELMIAWGDLPAGVYYALYGVVVLSIIFGNLGALVQPNIKRLLAYSGVSHSGYFMIPLLAVMTSPELMDKAELAVTYYLLAYGVMTVLAFGVATTLGPEGERDIDRYAGLARRSPVLAAAMALALLSMTGVPITVGFVGKFRLFAVAVDAGLYPLAIFALLASVASAYYYLRVVVKMYMEEPPAEAEPIPLEGSNALALLAGVVCIFLFAVLPALVV